MTDGTSLRGDGLFMASRGHELGSPSVGLQLGVSLAQAHLTVSVALHVVQGEYVVLFVVTTCASVAQDSLPNVHRLLCFQSKRSSKYFARQRLQRPAYQRVPWSGGPLSRDLSINLRALQSKLQSTFDRSQLKHLRG